MSKIISDEQMVDLAFTSNAETGETFLKPYPELCDAIAKAQRDSSDREWIEKLENQALHADNYYSWGQKFLLSDSWQTLTQKEA